MSAPSSPHNHAMTFVLKHKRFFIHIFLVSIFVNTIAFVVPLHMLQVYDRVLTSGHVETLVVITSAVIFALVFQAIFESIRGRLFFGLSLSFEKSIQEDVFSLSILQESQKKQNRSLNLWNLASTFKAFITTPYMSALIDLPWVPIYLLVIYFFHPILGLTATVCTILMVVIAFINYKVTKQQSEAFLKTNSEIRSYLDNAVLNADAMVGLGMLPQVQARWVNQVGDLNEKLTDHFSIASFFSSITKWFRLFVQVLMLSVGAYLVLKEEMSSGAIIANSIMLSRALGPIESISSGWKTIQEAFASFRLLSSLPSMTDNKKVSKEAIYADIDGELLVENLYYHIGQPPRPIIKGTKFKIARGDVLAVVGPSGGGKSTLLKLMLGILEPTGGMTKFDGSDIRALSSNFYNEHIGYLPQQLMLFTGSVKENIARFNEVDEEKVIEAAKMAGCHDMITQFPDGYETLVGINGSHLSLGQQQRIGLARALYQNPQYLFLDEPNSNLDGDGDKAFADAISTLASKGKTIVIVAHRTIILNLCNKMLLLKDGQQVMFGPKEEVLKKLNT